MNSTAIADAPARAQEAVRVAIDIAREAGFEDAIRWLRGDPLGHPMHPALVDGAGGYWMSSITLDILAALGFRSFGRAADAMLAAGLVSAAPTIAAGATEYADLPERTRSKAFTHAILGVSATVLYASSMLYRLLGRRRRAFLLSAAASGLAILGAHRGGKLVFEDGAGQSPRLPLD
jgi:hypothetical protein